MLYLGMAKEILNYTVMNLQYNNYKPQTKHVDRRMFPSRSKNTFKGILVYAGVKKPVTEKVGCCHLLSHANLKATTTYQLKELLSYFTDVATYLLS